MNSGAPKNIRRTGASSLGKCLLFLASILLTCHSGNLSAAEARPRSQAESSSDWLSQWRATNKVWRGVHVMVRNDNAASELMAELPELAALGVNALVDYSFAFVSHPELRETSALTREQAGRLARACRERGIRPIPLFNCLGHQSWSKHTGPLLTKYPELDETPGQFPENKGIYCRSWCPQNPKVCDWHYEDLAKYPGRPADYGSIPFFLEKGFRVWPGGWKNVQATEALLNAERKHQHERLLGHLCTTWGAVKIRDLAERPPIRAATKK